MPYTGDKKRAYQLAWVTKRRQAWIDDQGGVCAKCGSNENLEVDHIDPKLKTMQPAAIWSRSDAVRSKELANCQVLCYDCHLKKSAIDRAPEHGTHDRYASIVHRCRCDLCTKAHSDLARATRLAGKKW